MPPSPRFNGRGGDAISSLAPATSYEETPRKRAAYLRKQQRACDALPLFAAMVRSDQLDVDTEMVRRAERWAIDERNNRLARAARWREARARLFALSDTRRPVIRDLWRTCPYPADPSYLADLLHQIALGSIDPERAPLIFRPDQHPTIASDRTRFEAVFRRIGQRKVGGGHKTNAADGFLWCGNLSSGLLFPGLAGAPQRAERELLHLLGPQASGFPCRSVGHWIDITVRGECADADLALIQRLAQAADSRRVVVRRHQPRRHVGIGGGEGQP